MAVDRKAEILNTADGQSLHLVGPEENNETFKGVDMRAWYKRHPPTPEEERAPVTLLTPDNIVKRLGVRGNNYSLVEEAIHFIIVDHLSHRDGNMSSVENSEPVQESKRPSVLKVVHNLP